MYRIRRLGAASLDYVGQSGRLRGRMRDLRGVFAEVMPFTDPHVGAPARWAVRHATGCQFEVSVAPMDVDQLERMALEAVVVSWHRKEFGGSPTCQFGRILEGYQIPSNRKRGRQGGLMEGTPSIHAASLPLAGDFEGDVLSPTWCGHEWTEWQDAATVARRPGPEIGLYRLGEPNSPALIYIGQGRIRSRIRSHLAKRQDLELPWNTLESVGASCVRTLVNPGAAGTGE